MLAGLPGRRVVFTNGSESYARRVLGALGVQDMMDGIYGIEFMEYVAKPSPYPYEKLLRATGASGASASGATAACAATFGVAVHGSQRTDCAGEGLARRASPAERPSCSR